MKISYLKQLDGFRFLAVFAVLVFHFAPIKIVNDIPLGFGVFLFFVLSSFLITRILLAVKESDDAAGQSHFLSLRQFYIRRSLRIFPVYYLLVAFLLVVNWKPSRDVVVSLLTYTINYKIGSGYDVGSMIHLWSLAVEEQFYIIFPFAIFLIPAKYLLRFFLIITALGVIGRAGLYLYDETNVYFSNFHFLSALDSLGVGAILAYLNAYNNGDLKKLISNRLAYTMLFLIFFAVMVTTYSLPSAADRFNFGSVVVLRFLFNVLSFWILGWAVVIEYGGIWGRFLEDRIVMYLGKISYGIYLYHKFVPKLAGIVLGYLKIDIITIVGNGTLGIAFNALLYTVITIFVASVSWYLIEKPCNNVKRWFDYSKQKTASESVTS